MREMARSPELEALLTRMDEPGWEYRATAKELARVSDELVKCRAELALARAVLDSVRESTVFRYHGDKPVLVVDDTAAWQAWVRREAQR